MPGGLPGIYVEIKGDYSELEKNIKAAKKIVSSQATEISDSLNNALSPAKVRSSINSLVTQFGTLDRASKISKDTFSKVNAELGEFGKMTGLTKKQLASFQSRLLETQAAKAQENALKRLKSQLNLTTREVSDLGKKFGLSEASIRRVTGEFRSQQSVLQSMRSHWLGYTAAITAGYIAIRRITDVIGRFVEKAGEQASVEKRLDAVIKSTGNAAGLSTRQMIEMAAALQKVTKVGDETIIAGQAILATFKEIKGDAFERATKAALDMSEVMQQDLKSSITQIGKALNDPIKGLTALSKVGVSFTETQKRQIKTLQESGRIYEAQAIILKELESEFGGAAKAARDADGGLQTLGNAFGDLQEKIGGALINSRDFRDVIASIENLITDPAFVSGVAETTSLLVKFAAETVKIFSEHDAFIGFRMYLELQRKVKKAQAEYIEELKAAGGEIEHYKNGVQIITRLLDESVPHYKANADGVAELVDKTNDLTSANKDLSVALKPTAAELAEILKKQKEYVAFIDQLAAFRKTDLSSPSLGTGKLIDDSDPFGLTSSFKDLTGPGSGLTAEAKKIGINTGNLIGEGINEGLEKSTNEVTKLYEHQFERIQDLTSDIFRDIANRQIETMEDAWNRIGDYAIGVLSEVAAKSVLASASTLEGLKSSIMDISRFITVTLSSNPYFLLAAAVVAGGYALSQNSGKQAVDDWVYSTGKGTVLGDSTLESESFSHSLDRLNEINLDSYDELQGIRSEMIQLNSNLTGVVSSIARSIGTFTAEDFGIEVGKFQEKVFDNWGNAAISEAFGALSSVAFNWGQQQLGGAFENLTNWIIGGGKKRELVTSGIQTGGISIEDILAGAGIDTQAFARVRTTKSGIFGSSSSFIRTEYQAVDTITEGFFTQLYESMGKTMIELAKGLGTDNIEQVMSYMFDVSNIDLKDLSGDEVAAAISSWVSEQGDIAVQALFGELVSQYQRLDEGLLETAVRLLTDKESVFNALEKTNQSFVGTNKEAIAFSETLIDLAGDLETLTSAAETYYNSFFSESERFEDLSGSLSDSLSGLGVKLPDTRAGFRALVEGLDLTTSSGQELYTALLKLSDSAGQYYDRLESVETSRNQLLIQQYTLEGNTAEATALSRQMRIEELKAIDDSLVPIQERIWALEDEKKVADERLGLERQLMVLTGDTAGLRKLERDALDESNRELYDRVMALQDEQDAMEAAAAAAKELANQLWNTESLQLKLRGFSSDEARLAQIAGRYSWEGRYSTGNVYDWQAIGENFDMFASLSTEEAQSRFAKIAERLGLTIDDVISDIAFVSDYMNNATSGAADQVAEIASVISDNNDDLQKALEDQIRTIEDFNDMLQSRIDQLYGLSGSEIATESARSYINQAVAAAVSTGILPDADRLSSSIDALIDSFTAENYATSFDLEKARLALAGQLRLLKSIGLDQLAGIPKFASGGYHSGGIRLVGEQGPELEVTGPAMYLPFGKGGSGDITSEIRALREQNAAQARALVKLNLRVAKVLEQWDGDGIPEERAVS